MEINYVAISIATIFQFFIGILWHSSLIFGNKRIFYKFQIILIFIATTFLSIFIRLIPDYSPYLIAIYVLIGFYVPNQITGIILSNIPKKLWLKEILVLASLQLVSVLLATYILTF